MRITKDATDAKGVRRINVQLQPGESVFIRSGLAPLKVSEDVTPVFVSEHHHYRLGGQVDDVMSAHVLTEAEAVYWDNFEQKWMAA